MECLSPNKDIKKHHLLYFPHRAPLSIQQLEKNYINQEKKQRQYSNRGYPFQWSRKENKRENKPNTNPNSLFDGLGSVY